MDAATLTIFGWNDSRNPVTIPLGSKEGVTDNAISSHWLFSPVEHQAESFFQLVLSPDDCLVIDERICHCFYRQKGESGLLSHCMQRYREIHGEENPLPQMVLIQCSKNVVVFTDEHDCLYSFGLHAHQDLATASTSASSVLANSSPHPTSSSSGSCVESNQQSNNIYTRLTLHQLDIYEKVAQLAVGDTHFLLLTTGGSVYGMGSCVYGELGLGVTTPFVSVLQRLKRFDRGEDDDHDDECRKDGGGSGSGSSASSDHTKAISFPQQTPSTGTAVYIAAGIHYSAVIVHHPINAKISTGDAASGSTLSTGGAARGGTNSLYTFGHGAYYKLGHGTDNDCLWPTLVSTFEDVGELQPDGKGSGVRLVACGLFHMVAVVCGCDDVYAWGYNKYFQCGPEPAPGSGLGSSSAQGPGLGRSGLGRVWSEPQRVQGLDDVLARLTTQITTKQKTSGNNSNEGNGISVENGNNRGEDNGGNDQSLSMNIVAVTCGSRHTALVLQGKAPGPGLAPGSGPREDHQHLHPHHSHRYHLIVLLGSVGLPTTTTTTAATTTSLYPSNSVRNDSRSTSAANAAAAAAGGGDAGSDDTTPNTITVLANMHATMVSSTSTLWGLAVAHKSYG